MRVITVGCTSVGVELRSTSILVQPTVITRTQYNKSLLAGPPEDEQVMLETAFHSNTGSANCHNMHAVYQVLFLQRFLRMSK
jgi:hypothetical protein